MERDHQLRGQDYRTGGDAGKKPGSFSVVITGSDLEVCGLAATSSICSTGWWLVVLNHTKPLQTISPSFLSLTKIAMQKLLAAPPQVPPFQSPSSMGRVEDHTARSGQGGALGLASLGPDERLWTPSPCTAARRGR